MKALVGSVRRAPFRAFVTFVVLAAFSVMAASGLVMYFWRAVGAREVAGLDRGAWNAVHTCVSFLAIFGAVVHTLLNWQVIVRYIRRRAGEQIGHLRECVLALVLVGAVVVGTLLGVPPFSVVAPKEHHGPPPTGAAGGPPSGGMDFERGETRPD